ncbi:hypothetical protein niasHT_026634 [Heterodera trifolii]|uniref:C2H2-type domain-containing protein n=1 Tax=Heterodera trifolii TaxID=157864 RepID=A0ABD2KSS2_9BILA
MRSLTLITTLITVLQFAKVFCGGNYLTFQFSPANEYEVSAIVLMDLDKALKETDSKEEIIQNGKTNWEGEKSVIIINRNILKGWQNIRIEFGPAKMAKKAITLNIETLKEQNIVKLNYENPILRAKMKEKVTSDEKKGEEKKLAKRHRTENKEGEEKEKEEKENKEKGKEKETENEQEIRELGQTEHPLPNYLLPEDKIPKYKLHKCTQCSCSFYWAKSLEKHSCKGQQTEKGTEEEKEAKQNVTDANNPGEQKEASQSDAKALGEKQQNCDEKTKISDEKPYECEICHKRYSRLYYFEKHMSAH